MSLMQQWEDRMEALKKDTSGQQKFWTDYFLQEKAIYEQLLEEPVEVVSGTVQELADKYGMDVFFSAADFWMASMKASRNRTR